MIRVIRGAEPPELPPIRSQEVARVEALALAGTLSSKDFGDRYKGTSADELLFKRTLWKAQHYKCCFCEYRERLTNRDLEHFRPKSVYWWLAWSWENLLFSCDHCNRYHKNDQFPLRHEAHRLRPKEAPPGREQPRVIDPSDHGQDPAEHLIYRRMSARVDDWWVTPRNGSPRGAKTIDVLGLNNGELRVLYSRHWSDLQPDLERLGQLRDKALQQLRAGSPSACVEFQDEWRRTTRAKLSPSASFSAMSHDVFDHCFPAVLRARLGVTLTRP
ncbi:hypothetical protein L6R46_14135 [Myxococcota bacterium]|nr:hypothetical protein [Myxococcota bacterium]